MQRAYVKALYDHFQRQSFTGKGKIGAAEAAKLFLIRDVPAFGLTPSFDVAHMAIKQLQTMAHQRNPPTLEQKYRVEVDSFVKTVRWDYAGALATEIMAEEREEMAAAKAIEAAILATKPALCEDPVHFIDRGDQPCIVVDAYASDAAAVGVKVALFTHLHTDHAAKMNTAALRHDVAKDEVLLVGSELSVDFLRQPAAAEGVSMGGGLQLQKLHRIKLGEPLELAELPGVQLFALPAFHCPGSVSLLTVDSVLNRLHLNTGDKYVTGQYLRSLHEQICSCKAANPSLLPGTAVLDNTGIGRSHGHTRASETQRLGVAVKAYESE